MGLADLALTMSLGYGSDKFIKVLDSIMYTMINAAIQSSALLAKQKGVFPKYDFNKISKSKFYNDVLADETKEMVEKYGLRNSRLLSIAPTGSISNILGVSGGVEPYFLLGYQRTIKSMFESEKSIWVYEKTPLLLMKYLKIDHHDYLPDWAKVTSQNIDFDRRALVQSTIQKYVDTAISSTFNLTNDSSLEDIKYIYEKGWELGFKGATVFRDNCKKIGILMGLGNTVDKNPAKKPEIEIIEFWENKVNGELIRKDIKLKIEDSNYSIEKVQNEVCPICGSPLVKQGGCTKCSNKECIFEKCSL